MCWNEAFLWGTPFSQCDVHSYKLPFTQPRLGPLLSKPLSSEWLGADHVPRQLWEGLGSALCPQGGAALGAPGAKAACVAQTRHSHWDFPGQTPPFTLAQACRS